MESLGWVRSGQIPAAAHPEGLEAWVGCGKA